MPIIPKPNPDFVWVRDAAARIGVQPRTVRRWIRRGYLKAQKFSPRVQWAVSVRECHDVLMMSPRERKERVL